MTRKIVAAVLICLITGCAGTPSSQLESRDEKADLTLSEKNVSPSAEEISDKLDEPQEGLPQETSSSQ